MHRNGFGFLRSLLPGWTGCLIILAGCASPPPGRPFAPAQNLPEEAMITQRGVLTVLGRQYTLNGYVARSHSRGLRLIVTENFGNVLADVLVEPNGRVHVMRSSRALRPKWIERYVAADLACIFSDSPSIDCPGQKLSDTHFLIERRWYKLDLQTVETKPGRQRAEMFNPTPSQP
jgi:hypothetical protein